MRVDLITKEYPPNIYGGAGVHVSELTKALRGSIDVEIRAFGAPIPEPHTTGYSLADAATASNAAISTMQTDLAMIDDIDGADLVHSHTWYANFAGSTASRLYGIPHILTAHSLEPLRPWKAEQLGGGYRVSSWIEREAYDSAAGVIAVSAGMKHDIERAYPEIDQSKVTVIHNGIDTVSWHPNDRPDVLATFGIDPNRPIVVFVGRITRQKGLPYFLKAAEHLPKDAQLVLCAGAPDTQEILIEVRGLVDQLKAHGTSVFWIEDMLPRNELSAILSAATIFVCPSIYEPLGIVNLEAMACGVAVVATATGGIPEVVVDGDTGRLVALDQLHDGTGTPTDPDQFIHDMAQTVNEVLGDPALATRMGERGRQRAIDSFGWAEIARTTIDFYRTTLERWR